MRSIVERALAEDLGPDGLDVTSVATIPAGQTDVGDLVARADGVVAGLAVAALVFEIASTGTVAWAAKVPDGDRVARGEVLATVEGPTRALLTAERTALNFLCHLSGVATHTRAWAEALAGTGATVLDTRKTTPGLRELEKYAVRVGGGTNKRMGLYDVAMIKDNHKLAAGSITAAYRRVREAFPDVPVQVEVTTVAEAVEAGAVETLLVSDAVVRDVGIEDLMRSAESARGTVVLVSRHHEAGQKLEALGGIAALLRFPIK